MRKSSIPIKLFITLLCGSISAGLLSYQWFPAAYMPLLITPTAQSITPTTTSPSSPIMTTTATSSPVPTVTATVIEPFVNLTDLLMVEVEFYPDAPPKVVSVLPLEKGRLTPDGLGEVTLKVIDKNNKSIYEINLHPVFVFGEPAKKHESIRMTFIVPKGGLDTMIQISSAEWTTEYKIDGK